MPEWQPVIEPPPPPVEAVDSKLSRLKGRLFSNSLAMSLANLLSRALGYTGLILMARRLDARYLGAYALLFTSSMFVELVSNLGLDKILVREIANRPAADGKGYFWIAFPIRFGMALLSAAGAWTLLILLFRDSLLASRVTNAFFLAAIFPVVAARNCEALLTAHEFLLPIAVAQVGERVVFLGGVVLLFSGTIDFGGLLCFAPLAALARLAVVAWSTTSIWTSGVPSKLPNLRHMVRQASELFSVEILAQAYFRSDVFLLAKIGGLRATGVYQITYKIFDACLSLFSGFLQAAYPRLVRDQSERTLKAMLAWGVGLLAIPITFIILGRHFILGALSPQYTSGATSLIWLMLTVPLVYSTSTLANAAIAACQVRILIAIAALLLITNVGLNLLLIPKWSLNGAAFSTFVCELLSASVLGPIVFKRLALS